MFMYDNDCGTRLLMLIRPRNLPEVYWVGAGATLLVVLRLIPLPLAGRRVR